MKNPFKDFLYFSRGERRGILVLIIGIILIFLSGTKENASYMVPIFIVLLLLGVLAMVMFIQVELSFLAHP